MEEMAGEETRTAEAAGVMRLSDWPDWAYLLSEYYEMYRFLSAGGSERIRSHQRRVREAISKLSGQNPPLCLPEPQRRLPVTAHWGRALDEGRQQALPQVIRALDRIGDALDWQYGYDRMPPGLTKRYGFAEIASPNGPVVSEEVTLGLVLFAPGCTYPAHAHKSITESYICLSGAVSENQYGVFAAGSLIFNPPGHMHRITVSSREPALLAYAWIGSREDLASTRMRLGTAA
jgi:dimethylpropiothetin dethiomethylase